MIAEAAARYAAAIAEQLGEVVPVTDHVPATIAAPAVFVVDEGVTWSAGMWRVQLQAVILADAALDAGAAQYLLRTLADRVAAAAANVGVAADVSGGPDRWPVGSVSYPAWTVSTTVAIAACDLRFTEP